MYHYDWSGDGKLSKGRPSVMGPVVAFVLSSVFLSSLHFNFMGWTPLLSHSLNLGSYTSLLHVPPSLSAVFKQRLEMKQLFTSRVHTQRCSSLIRQFGIRENCFLFRFFSLHFCHPGHYILTCAIHKQLPFYPQNGEFSLGLAHIQSHPSLQLNSSHWEQWLKAHLAVC